MEPLSIYKALAHPTRRRIIEVLAEKGHAYPTATLFPLFGCSESAVSQHLKVLAKARLVRVHITFNNRRRYVVDTLLLREILDWAKNVTEAAEAGQSRFNKRFLANRRCREETHYKL